MLCYLPVAMNFSSDAVSKLGSYLTQDSVDGEDSDARSSSNYSSPAIELSPIFRALKGYALYKHHAKLEAIVNFLRLSSYNPIFISGDESILAKIDSICESPKLLLKRMKGAAKYPQTWTSHFSAKFICEVVELIEQDRKISDSKVARKSPRKKGTTTGLPPAASILVKMYQEARHKVENDSNCRKRKARNTTVKTVEDLLLKSAVHHEELVQVRSEQILHNLLCPICNHQSLVPITTKEEAVTTNDNIRAVYERKLKEWSMDGKKGTKPRMGKTVSQVLACSCYMQNCIGNVDGRGCFKCKELGGNVETKHDKR